MSSSSRPETLPTWDLTSIFPALDSPDFERAFSGLCGMIEAAVVTFDRLGIGDEQSSATSEEELIEAFETVFRALSSIHESAEMIDSYLYALTSVDSRDEAAQIRMSEFEQRMVAVAQLQPRVTAWLGTIDHAPLLEGSEMARDHRYLLERSNVRARHLMTPAEESLAAELHASGGSGWIRMYETVSAQITATIEIDGESKSLAMAELRQLALDQRRDVRSLAHEIEVSAWEANAVPIAAALNGIKGEAQTLIARRKWDSALEEALFLNGIDQGVLDAMLAAAFEFFPAAGDYFRAKARMLGVDQLAWFDLFAPIAAAEEGAWTYERATGLILRTFHAFSPKLVALATRAFDENWIDAPPRSGKSDGAYCTPFLPGISRIMMNYTPSYSALSTLAHELGHAYHNVAVENRPPLLRSSPSTLAETASIFCETLIRQEALKYVNPTEEMEILEGSLQDATQVVVDITSRFLFEQRLFAARVDHDVPISELCSLMTEAQRETYGDAIAPDSLHSYMWAAKGHYYDVDESFYNFPYMFGLLFGLGLFRVYQQEPDGFADRYDQLLSSTGMADAITLAATFDIDLHSIDFWRSSLDVIREDVRRFVELASAYAALT